MTGSTGRGLLVTQDVFFASKITGTAAALGFAVDVERAPDAVASRASAESYRCIIVDLATPGLNVASLVAGLPPENRPRVLAFGSHVHTALLNAAREAGCDEVMPRSRLSSALPEILRAELGASG